MTLIKWFVKIALMPVLLILKLIEWTGTFLIIPLSAVFNFLSWLFLGVAVLSYLMGLENGAETIRMIQSGFIIFLIPRVGEFLVGIVVAVDVLIMRHIMSKIIE